MDINTTAMGYPSQPHQMVGSQVPLPMVQPGYFSSQPVACAPQFQFHNEQQPQMFMSQTFPVSQYQPVNLQLANHTIYPALPPHTPSNVSNDWQVVTSKKRQRSPEEENKRSRRQTKINEYWLSNTTTSNRFSSLEEETGKDVMEATEANTKKEPKPPPIFVSGVENINPLIMLLKEIVADKYTIKSYEAEQVKIQVEDSLSYTKVIKELNDKKTEYHTYKSKENRTFRVVLKNIHPSINIEDIKISLQEKGHEVTNIWNIKQRITNKPLSMFFVDLKQSNNNKEIYKIKQLLNAVVSFEAPRSNREIPQCTRCQKYGHTKNFCHKNPRCVKCTANHHTRDCPRKTKDDEVKCVNCNESHPANYRGCIVHKQLQEKMYPKLSQKGNQPKNISQYNVQPNITYAQRLRQNMPQVNYLTNHNATIQQSNDMTELKAMMKELINQMGTMMNLISILVNKMS